MWKCEKCGGHHIVCNAIDTNLESGNDFYLNKEFGKVIMTIEVCWCSECGEPYKSSVLNLDKIE